MTNYTDLNIILDRSGSMQSIARDMEGGLQAFLQKEKNSGDDTRVSLFRFDGHYETVFVDKNIRDDDLKIELTPGGSTALMDAVGKTIQHVEQKLTNLLEEEKPNRVLFLIITDGEENSSVIYNRDQIKTMLSDKREKLAWDFVFMGVDEGKVMAQREQIGIMRSASLGFEKTSKGVQEAFTNISASYDNYKMLDRRDLTTYACSFEVSNVADSARYSADSGSMTATLASNTAEVLKKEFEKKKKESLI